MPIPLHHAETVEGFLLYVAAYEELGRELGFHCLFRGQTRDYFLHEHLRVMPYSFRQEGEAFSPGVVERSWVEQQLTPWVRFLGGDL
jgi:hypothetical protein